MKYKVVLYLTGTDPTPQCSYTFYTYNSAYQCCVSWLEVMGASGRSYLFDGGNWTAVTI